MYMHKETIATPKYRYTAVFEPAEEGGYSVTCPALPDLVTDGETLEEARAMATKAIRRYLESLEKDGLPTPVDFDSLERTIDQTFSLEEMHAKLRLKRPLRIKYGVDATAPFLHIGHAVNIWMMRELQEHGHIVVFLLGDFTTRIGDPSGKSETRKVIPREEIEANADEFLRQVSHILLTDSAVFEVRRNSEWYENMRLGDFMSLLSMVTHSKLIQRDMFQKRIQKGHEIHMHEMLYPILQGYDSVMLKSDLTIVGTDQLFNELMGRFYQEKLGQTPQVVITTKITPGTDGVEKQSKSIGNYIALTDAPRDKYGKVMSIPDSLIIPYLEIYTLVPVEKVCDMEKRMESGALNPHGRKKGACARRHRAVPRKGSCSGTGGMVYPGLLAT